MSENVQRGRQLEVVGSHIRGCSRVRAAEFRQQWDAVRPSLGDLTSEEERAAYSRMMCLAALDEAIRENLVEPQDKETRGQEQGEDGGVGEVSGLSEEEINARLLAEGQAKAREEREVQEWAEREAIARIMREYHRT